MTLEHENPYEGLGVGQSPKRFLGQTPVVDSPVSEALRAMARDSVFAVTCREGGTWVPWSEWKKLNSPGPDGKRVHAIMWDDGRIWDACSGFRPPSQNAMSKEDIMRVWGEMFRAKEILLSQMRREPEVFGDI